MTSTTKPARTPTHELKFVRVNEILFSLWRGGFKCGGVYLNDFAAMEIDRGWYAYQIRHGREQRQRKPSASPEIAAQKMWGSKGKAALQQAGDGNG